MSRDEGLFLEEVRVCAERVLEYTNGMTFLESVADARTHDAVLQRLEIIGEAARHLSDETLATMPTIPWRAVRRMRNILAHADFGIDDDIVWDVIERHLPELVRVLSKSSTEPSPE